MLMAAEERKDRHRAAEIQQLRRDWQGVETLRALADSFRDQAAKLDGFAQAIQDLGGNEVYLDGVTKGEAAKKSLSAYLTNIEIAIVKRSIRKKPDTKKRINRS